MNGGLRPSANQNPSRNTGSRTCILSTDWPLQTVFLYARWADRADGVANLAMGPSRRSSRLASSMFL